MIKRMTIRCLPIALLIGSAAGCSASTNDEGSVDFQEIIAQQAGNEMQIELPHNEGGNAVIRFAVTPPNAQQSITIVILANDAVRPFSSFTFYPANGISDFMLEVPEEVRLLRFMPTDAETGAALEGVNIHASLRSFDRKE